MCKSDRETPEPLRIPAEIHQQAQEVVRGAFHSLGDHLQRLNQDLDEFSRKRQEVREKIKSGARRTSGRII